MHLCINVKPPLPGAIVGTACVGICHHIPSVHIDQFTLNAKLFQCFLFMNFITDIDPMATPGQIFTTIPQPMPHHALLPQEGGLELDIDMCIRAFMFTLVLLLSYHIAIQLLD